MGGDGGWEPGGGKGMKDGGEKGKGKGKGGMITSSNYGVRGGFARRRAFDLNAGATKFLENWNLGIAGKEVKSQLPLITPHNMGAREVTLPHLLPRTDLLRGGASICTRQVVVCYNKSKTAANALAWNPTGRRLCVGNHNGEVSLWNMAQGCNFEIVQQSHTGSMRFVKYVQSGQLDEILFTADQAGVLKLWDKNFCNTVRLQPHDNIPMRDMGIGPGLEKFVTCADEPTVKVWDFRTLKPERTLLGHGYDCRALDWHPWKGLIATGSKDNQLKLYDPRQETAIVTLYHHKNSIAKMRFQPNGMALASGGKDQLIHILDIRTMKIKNTLKGHLREVTSLTWHPKLDNVLVSAGFDSNIYHWDLYHTQNYKDEAGICHPQQIVRGCHEGGTTALDFHPLGHVLASSGRDGNVKLWCRAKPGDDSKQQELEFFQRQQADLLAGYGGFLNPDGSFAKGKGKKGKKGNQMWSTSNLVDEFDHGAAGERKDLNSLEFTNPPLYRLKVNKKRAAATMVSDSAVLTKEIMFAAPTLKRLKLIATEKDNARRKRKGSADSKGSKEDNNFEQHNPFIKEEEPEDDDEDMELSKDQRINPATGKPFGYGLKPLPKAFSQPGKPEGLQAKAGSIKPEEGVEPGEEGGGAGIQIKQEQPAEDENNNTGAAPPPSSSSTGPNKGGRSHGNTTRFATLEGDEQTPWRGLKVIKGSKAGVPLLQSMGVFSDATMVSVEKSGLQQAANEQASGALSLFSHPGAAQAKAQPRSKAASVMGAASTSSSSFIERIKRSQDLLSSLASGVDLAGGQFDSGEQQTSTKPPGTQMNLLPSFDELKSCLRKKGLRRINS